jgi:hypothetical protein
MADHDDHVHGHHEHESEHGNHHAHEDEATPGIARWAAGAASGVCPACGASGALSLGGGLFCPTCGEISTSPGYKPPQAEAAPEQLPD